MQDYSDNNQSYSYVSDVSNLIRHRSHIKGMSGAMLLQPYSTSKEDFLPPLMNKTIVKNEPLFIHDSEGQAYSTYDLPNLVVPIAKKKKMRRVKKAEFVMPSKLIYETWRNNQSHSKS